MLDVTILAVLQGVAEFLPISSSGHLVLGKSLLGIEESGMRLDVFLHAGTLLAVMAFYFRVVFFCASGLFSSSPDERDRSRAYVLKIILSAIPVGVAGFVLAAFIEDVFSKPVFVASALAFTGVVLVATRFMPQGRGDVSFFSALVMGLAQALAVFPGVSRSGMTLAAARAAGVDAEKAAEFSFMMSLPPIAGAVLFEVIGTGASAARAAEFSWPLVFYGAAVSAVVGWFALALLLKTLRGRCFWLFGLYCLAASAATFAAI